MRNAGLEKAQAGIKIARRNINNLRYADEIKRHLLLGIKAMTLPRQHIIKQRHYFANKGPSSQSYGFSSGHVWM